MILKFEVTLSEAMSMTQLLSKAQPYVARHLKPLVKRLRDTVDAGIRGENDGSRTEQEGA